MKDRCGEQVSWLHEPAVNQPARVLLVSQRATARQVSRALQFEYEDFVQTVDSVDLVASARRGLPPSMVRRAMAMAAHLAPVASGLLEGERPRVGRYDLVFVAVESLHDLEFVRPLTWLLRRARVSVCLVDEVWRKGLERRTGELRLLSHFDHVLVGTAGAVEAIADLTGRPSSYLAPSVDALALCPYPDQPPRAIDVYSMGRRSPMTHAALLNLAERKRWFYLYDTLVRARMPDHRQHRRHLGGLLKRTRYFLAYPGKMDAPEETGGQQELGFRYFEGAAAGAVLIGEAPANSWSEKLFGWKDAIVRLPYAAEDPEALLAAFDLAPEREQAIRRANVVESLRRHDHVYRWSEVLRLVGLPEIPSMELRRRQLRELADSISRGSAHDAFLERVARHS